MHNAELCAAQDLTCILRSESSSNFWAAGPCCQASRRLGALHWHGGSKQHSSCGKADVAQAGQLLTLLCPLQCKNGTFR